MKNVRTALALLLVSLLLFTMVACMPVEKPDPDPTGRPDPTETTGEVPDIQNPTEATFSECEYRLLPYDFEIRRDPQEIWVNPFTAEEMEAALATVRAYMEEFSQAKGTLTFEVEKITFDPIMTEVDILGKFYVAPTMGWAIWDYYENMVSFSVTYSATYDHSATFMEDAEHATIKVEVRRENELEPWVKTDHGVPVEEHSHQALSREELAQVAQEGEQILGGYRLEDGTLWLYLWDSVDEKPFFVERKP